MYEYLLSVHQEATTLLFYVWISFWLGLVVASYICIACQKNVWGIIVAYLNHKQDCLVLLKWRRLWLQTRLLSALPSWTLKMPKMENVRLLWSVIFLSFIQSEADLFVDLSLSLSSSTWRSSVLLASSCSSPATFVARNSLFIDVCLILKGAWGEGWEHWS